MRGPEVPSFYNKMFKNKVENLLDKALMERNDLFLINFSIQEDNHIKVIIDGDLGVSVEDCMYVSRVIEHNLDREEEDFSLEVMSAGATSPLVNKRQYIKNKSRNLKVQTVTEVIEGVLVDATETGITLEWKTKEAKAVGKGKVWVDKRATIAYPDIVEAKVMIKF